jgi:hypothetical protein
MKIPGSTQWSCAASKRRICKRRLRSTIAAQTAKLLRQAVIEESNGMLKRAM